MVRTRTDKPVASLQSLIIAMLQRIRWTNEAADPETTWAAACPAAMRDAACTVESTRSDEICGSRRRELGAASSPPPRYRQPAPNRAGSADGVTSLARGRSGSAPYPAGRRAERRLVRASGPPSSRGPPRSGISQAVAGLPPGRSGRIPPGRARPGRDRSPQGPGRPRAPRQSGGAHAPTRARAATRLATP